MPIHHKINIAAGMLCTGGNRSEDERRGNIITHFENTAQRISQSHGFEHHAHYSGLSKETLKPKKHFYRG